MNQAGFLDKNKQVDPSMDFHHLRTEGIKIIQELTGEFWTDFNIHDPGVTILEQLCYALTELSFRTGYDIEQLLFREGKGDLPFFKPEEILTNNPLSDSDIRKVFLDNVPEIKNIWLEPVYEQEGGFNGLYRVLVDTSLLAGNEEEEQRIIKEIRKIFSQHRNICEDIFDIKILEQLPIKICAEIETDGLNELGQIMANIFFAVEQNINPEVKFHSLEELLDKDKNYNEIFDGPRLKHGFIQSEELIPQPETIVVSDVVKLVMEVEGVVSVKNLHLELDGDKYYNQLVIPGGKIPKFIHSETIKDAENYSIKFYKGNLAYNGFKASTFRKFLNELVSEHKKSYRISGSTFEIPEVHQDLNFEEYFSVQEHFPAIYGVGSEGIPNKPTVKRKAQANQLKGYLMIFEQFMANYLSQLAHFKDLLSIHKKLDTTYFCQPLDNVPEAKRFYATENESINDAYLDFGNIPRHYEKGLTQLNEYFDDFIDRKNRMLDFLLAVHGESYSKYSLSQFNYYYTDQEFKRFQIKCKSALLQQLAHINYNRASGNDYFDTEKTESTGLEKKLNILLGLGLQESKHGQISIEKRDTLFDVFERFNVKLITTGSNSTAMKAWNDAAELKHAGLTQKQVNAAFDFIDDEDLEDVGMPENEKLIEPVLPFRINQISSDFMVSGIELMNYKAGPAQDDKGGWALVHRTTDKENWKLIARFNNEKDLLQAVNLFRSRLIQMNTESEGLHLVENILLRPQPQEPKYGIYIKDEHGNYVLKSNKQYSINERKDKLSLIKESISTYEYFSVEADDNRNMNIVFKIPDTDLTFISVKSKESVEETHSQMENLYRFLADKDKESAFDAKTGFYIQYKEGETDIPDSFYTYKVSLVLPGWTARFNNSEFRSIVKDVVWEQKPATVYADIHWLSPGDMKTFEKFYAKWKSKQLLESEAADYSNETGSADLAKFLYSRSEL